MSWLKKEGQQLKSRDTGKLVKLLIVEQFGFAHYPANREMLKFIDTVANNGGNGVRVFGFFPFGKGHEEEPYVRTSNGFDLNRFNDTYFVYLQEWVEHAYRKGIVVLYELFDSVGLKHKSLSQYHPFGEFNKGERLLFSDLNNYLLVRHQKAYVAKVVNLLKHYPNVIFGLMNEFKGKRNWHYEISKYVKSLAPHHLISGSHNGSPAMGDPSVDIWAIHTGSFDFKTCRSNIRKDVRELRPHIGSKIIAYSTDGFGLRGKKCATPENMRRLAEDINNNNLQIFRFLDQFAYVGRDESGKEYPPGSWLKTPAAYETAEASRLRPDIYRAIAPVFSPTQFVAPSTPTTPQEPAARPKGGVVYAAKAVSLDSSHPEIRQEKGGKAVAATTTQGYLCSTPTISGLPAKSLDVGFSVFIDNNSCDDKLVLILDVYDVAQKRILAKWAVTRKEFARADAFNLLKFSFTPQPGSQVKIRTYYFGYAYLAIDKLAIADPSQHRLNAPSDIPNVSVVPDTSSTIPPETGGLIEQFNVADLPFQHAEAFLDRGGRAIRATPHGGFLVYGQYVKGYPAKALKAYFSVFIDNNSADDLTIMSLDCYDSFQKKLLARTKISRRDFPTANDWSLFSLKFRPVKESILEFRIYYHGNAYLAADKIAVVDPEKVEFENHAQFTSYLSGNIPSGPSITPVPSITPDTSIPDTPTISADAILGTFNVAKLPSNHPGAFPDRGGRAIAATDQGGFISFGPYVKGYPAKKLEAYFSLFIDNNAADDLRIVSLDCYDAANRKVLKRASVSRRDFPVSNDWSLFKLSFTPKNDSNLEFRIYYHGNAYLAADKIAVVDPEQIQFENHAQFLSQAFSSRPTPTIIHTRPSSGGTTNEDQPEENTVVHDDANVIVHIPQFTREIVKQAGGQDDGVKYDKGMFRPENKGGVELVQTIDTSRRILIEFEVEGNIANAGGEELGGGKVSLIDIMEQGGRYYMSLQRMHHKYRGGGRLRLLITNNRGSSHGAAFIVSAPGMAGDYSTLRWGNEPHRFGIILHSNRAQLSVDNDYRSKEGKARGPISGNKRVSIMIGNRVGRKRNQHAVTWFKNFTMKYV
jgi:hypothetical protein